MASDPQQLSLTLLVVGLGTLGSSLVELVVRQAQQATWRLRSMLIIDDDYVEPHNIAKSAIYRPGDVRLHKVHAVRKWIGKMSPKLPVAALPERVEYVGLGPFRGADVVLVALDNYSGKLTACRQAWLAGARFIMVGELAGGQGLSSRYRHFTPGPELPCLECSWQEEYAQLETRFPCSPEEVARRGPPSRLSVAQRTAAHMVEDMERLLLADRSATPAEEVRLHPAERRILTFYPVRNPDCLFDHQVLDGLVGELTPDARRLTLADALCVAEEHLPGITHVRFHQPVATRFACPHGHEWSRLQRGILRPPPCPACGRPGLALDLQLVLPLRHKWLDTPLVESIVPPGDVLTFVAGGDSAHCSATTVHVALPLPPEWQPRSRNAAPTVRQKSEGGDP